jgi:Arc/MetJ-type ribon-helix-helix transcriptional regulator
MEVVRTQIQLTERQAHELRDLAAHEGVSMAALIRKAVDQLLEDRGLDARWERALSVVGKYTDPEPGANVAEEHDRYLEEAYLDWRRS